MNRMNRSQLFTTFHNFSFTGFCSFSSKEAPHESGESNVQKQKIHLPKAHSPGPALTSLVPTKSARWCSLHNSFSIVKFRFHIISQAESGLAVDDRHIALVCFQPCLRAPMRRVLPQMRMFQQPLCTVTSYDIMSSDAMSLIESH